MENYNWGSNSERNLMRSVLDCVDEDGTLKTDIPARPVFVCSDADLALLAGYPPGTLAFSYDGQHAWVKKPDGLWTDWLADDTAAT